MKDEKGKVAIITGANAGVGFGIAYRLLELEGSEITVVMACRNKIKASLARDQLLLQFPAAQIDIEIVDVNSIESVFTFCKNIQQKYDHVNHLFCNAGILSALGLKWGEVFWLFLKDPIGFTEKSDSTIQAIGEVNEDGMGKVFASNVFGHYVMMRELEQLLSNSSDGRVIWTSSITANETYFDIQDWQGVKSAMPYESSKWACDLIAIAINEQFEKKGLKITSFTTSPGVVASSIGELPQWVTIVRILLHYTMRFIGVTSQNISGYRGAIADVHTALCALNNLNTMCRYTSLTNRWGTSFVGKQFLPGYEPTVAEKLIEKCEFAYQARKAKLDHDSRSM